MASARISSVQSLSHVRLFLIPWTAACQPIANYQSLFKLMSTELVMLSNHLILCHPLLLLPSVFPSLNVFFSESVVCIRWPKYGSFSFSISPSSEYSGLISFKIVQPLSERYILFCCVLKEFIFILCICHDAHLKLIF